MKKILALALCAIMMVAMMASVSAVDYILDYNFEDDFEGDFIAVDKSIGVSPKQFSIQVVKYDNTMCMKYDRTDYVEGAGDKDCFSDLMGGGSESVWGLGPVFVMSYDINFEKLEATETSTPSWQIGMLRMTPPAGTQFQQSFCVVGNQIVAYSDVNQPLMEVQTGKWYNFAVLFDMKNKCFSMYVDGVLISDSLDWNVADTSSTEAERIRIAWNGNGDATYNGIAYVDNIKFYNAEKPENATGAKLETTTAAPETQAPETTAAPAQTTAAATQAPAAPAPATPAAPTADIAVVLAAVSAIAASGVVVFKKRH